MKVIFFAAILGLCAGCDFNTNFVKHTMKATEAGNCTARTHRVDMTSNTNGQRFLFDYCLPAGSSNPSYTIGRKGDTLDLKFAGEGQVLYNITLDVDANPAYHFIRLGDQLVAVVKGTY